MPHPRLSLRNGPSHLQSALLLGRSSNNRLVIGGVLQLELMVTMISDTLTSLSYETGMYVYSNVRDTNNIVIAYRRSPTTQLLISTSFCLSRKHKPDDGSFIAKADPLKSLPEIAKYRTSSYPPIGPRSQTIECVYSTLRAFFFDCFCVADEA